MSNDITLEQFKARLAAHDWYYHKSDNPIVQQTGKAESVALFEIMADKPAFRQAYIDYVDKNVKIF